MRFQLGAADAASASVQMTSSTQPLRLNLLPTDRVGTSWYAELGPGAARLGMVTVGPTAFVARLAGLLGIPVAPLPDGRRIAKVHDWLEREDDGNAWYSQARAEDPWGVAQWMLFAQDRLRRLGWSGQPSDATPRLGALSRLREVEAVKQGQVELEHAVTAALGDRSPAASVQVRLAAPRDHYPATIARILDALEARGMEIGTHPDAAHDPSSLPDTDLGRVQRALLDPAAKVDHLAGDGSLLWLRAPTVREAALLTVARCDDQATWIVPTGGAMLDETRAASDRPRLGLSDDSPFRPALQVLPLVLAMQFSPRDPEVALELLTLAVTPVPWAVRRRLIDRLKQAPGVGGPGWQEAVEAGLEEHQQRHPEADIVKVRARIGMFIPDDAPAQRTAAELGVVVEEVAAWARGRGAQSDDPILMAAAGTAGRLAEMLASLDSSATFDRNRAAQLHDVAVGSGVALPVQAEAGAPPCTPEPASLWRSVDQVVWFGAVEGVAELPREIAWTPDELEALAKLGLSRDSLARCRDVEQSGWRRAVLAAKRQLTLVSWAYEGIEPISEHPAFDLLEAAVSKGGLDPIRVGLERHLEADKRVVSVSPAPIRSRRPLWNVNATAALERSWSASSIEALIDCPLRWVLKYAARLEPGAVDTIGQLKTITGTFAHALFEEVLFEDSPGWDRLTPEHASSRLLERFDARVGHECAPLTLDANRGYATLIRQKLANSMAALVELLKAKGWRPVAAEKKLTELGGTFEGEPLSGSIDLLVEREDGTKGVVDLKLGGLNYRRDQLEDGKALQLAVYAEGAREGAPDHPPVGYFILDEGVLVTPNSAAFGAGTQHVEAAGDAGPGETLLAARGAWSRSKELLGQGLVQARAKALQVDEIDAELAEKHGISEPDHPWAKDRARCQYCDARRLCEFSLEEGEA